MSQHVNILRANIELLNKLAVENGGNILINFDDENGVLQNSALPQDAVIMDSTPNNPDLHSYYVYGVQGENELAKEINLVVGSLFRAPKEYEYGKQIAKAIWGDHFELADSGKHADIDNVLFCAHYGILAQSALNDDFMLKVLQWEDSKGKSETQTLLFNLARGYQEDPGCVALLNAFGNTEKVRTEIEHLAQDPQYYPILHVEDLAKAFQNMVKQALGKASHRGIVPPKVNVSKASLYAFDIDGYFKKKPVLCADGKTEMADSEGTSVTESVLVGKLVLPRTSNLVNRIPQRENRLLDVLKCMYLQKNQGDLLKLFPLTYTISLTLEDDTEEKLTAAVKDVTSGSTEESVLLAKLQTLKKANVQLAYEDRMQTALFQHGFWARFPNPDDPNDPEKDRFVHYQYLTATQSQARATRATFALDTDNLGYKLTAQVYFHMIAGRGDAWAMIKKHGALAVFQAIQNQVSAFRTNPKKGETLTLAEMRRTPMSKLIARFGLSASTTIDGEGAINADVSKAFKRMQEHMATKKLILLPSGGNKRAVTTTAHELSMKPMPEEQCRKNHTGKTHDADLSLNEYKWRKKGKKGKRRKCGGVTFHTTVADSQILIDIEFGADYSLALHYITPRDYLYFDEHWVTNNAYGYDPVALYKAQESTNPGRAEEAKKLVRIINKIRTGIQCRLPGDEALAKDPSQLPVLNPDDPAFDPKAVDIPSGHGCKGLAVKFFIRGDKRLRRVFKDEGIDPDTVAGIVPPSSAKFFNDSGNGATKSGYRMIDPKRIHIVNVNKGRDLHSNIAHMNAQFINSLGLMSDDLIQIAEDILKPLIENYNMDRRPKETPKEHLLRVLEQFTQLDYVGSGRVITAFNRARVLAMSNQKMWYESNHMKDLRRQMASMLTDLAKGRIPVVGDMLFGACDPYGALNVWFKDAFERLHIKPYETLYEHARSYYNKSNAQAGIVPWVAQKNIYFVNNEEDIIGVWRSPQNAEFEPQRGYAVRWDKLWFLNDILVFSMEECNQRKCGGADFDGDKFLVLLSVVNEVNEMLIDAITMAPEVDIDPFKLGEPIGAQSNKQALTKESLCSTAKAMAKKNLLGRISKWAAAFLGAVRHIDTALAIVKDDAFVAQQEHRAPISKIHFVVPAVEGMGWKASTGDPNMQRYDDLHKEMTDFMSKPHDAKSFERLLAQDKIDPNFTGYHIDKAKGVLYLEGWISMYQDHQTQVMIPMHVRDEHGKETDKYVGLYGEYVANSNGEFEELMRKREEFMRNNLIDAAAASIEVDATNNGYHSYFHEEASFMAVHELFRDMLKGKTINQRMAYSCYINIGPLGALFIDVMKHWNEVMSNFTPDKEVDMSSYILMLMMPKDLIAILNSASAIDDIKNDYVAHKIAIEDAYPDEDASAQRDSELKLLAYTTKKDLLGLTTASEGGKNDPQLTEEALAVACYLIGDGKEFSFLFVEKLQTVLENDPTAKGIEMMPKWYKQGHKAGDKEWMEAGLTTINNLSWLVVYKYKKDPKHGTTLCETHLVKRVNANLNGGVYSYVDSVSGKRIRVPLHEYTEIARDPYDPYARNTNWAFFAHSATWGQQYAAVVPPAPHKRVFGLTSAILGDLCGVKGMKTKVGKVLPTVKLVGISSSLAQIIHNSNAFDCLNNVLDPKGNMIHGTVRIRIAMGSNGVLAVHWYDPSQKQWMDIADGIEISMPGMQNFVKAVYKTCMVNHEIMLDFKGKSVKLSGFGTGTVSVEGAKIQAISALKPDQQTKKVRFERLQWDSKKRMVVRAGYTFDF